MGRLDGETGWGDWMERLLRHLLTYGFYSIVSWSMSEYSADLLDTTPPKQVPVHWE